MILDLKDADVSLFTRKSIGAFLKRLCRKIDMKAEDLHFWDDEGLPPEECQVEAHTKGTSAVQFILTSTIVIHTLDMTGQIFINVFSCKEFDADEAASFCAAHFSAEIGDKTVVVRGRP